MQSFMNSLLTKLPSAYNLAPIFTSPVKTFINDVSTRSFVSLSSRAKMLTSTLASKDSFLKPTLPDINQSCGLKVKGIPKRRCPDCYFVKRQERLYVMCKSHGRHKQVSMALAPKNTWILTHATQSKSRPW